MSAIPECGPARDRMVAEIIGLPWRQPTHGTCCTCQVCGWPHDECRCGYSEYSDSALAALEAWRLADPENRYWQIVASSAGEPRDVKAFHVCIFDQLAVWDADADTLPAAATAALLATKERE